MKESGYGSIAELRDVRTDVEGLQLVAMPCVEVAIALTEPAGDHDYVIVILDRNRVAVASTNRSWFGPTATIYEQLVPGDYQVDVLDEDGRSVAQTSFTVRDKPVHVTLTLP